MGAQRAKPPRAEPASARDADAAPKGREVAERNGNVARSAPRPKGGGATNMAPDGKAITPKKATFGACANGSDPDFGACAIGGGRCEGAPPLPPEALCAEAAKGGSPSSGASTERSVLRLRQSAYRKATGGHSANSRTDSGRYFFPNHLDDKWLLGRSIMTTIGERPSSGVGTEAKRKFPLQMMGACRCDGAKRRSRIM